MVRKEWNEWQDLSWDVIGLTNQQIATYRVICDSLQNNRPPIGISVMERDIKGSVHPSDEENLPVAAHQNDSH